MFSAKQSLDIGKIGEDVGAIYIKKMGLSIVKRNFRKKFGEIDIIASDVQNRLLIFFEVKTRIGFKEMRPEDSIDWRKIRKLENICSYYANLKINDNYLSWRIDLLAININPAFARASQLTKIYKYCEIRLYQNILGGFWS